VLDVVPSHLHQRVPLIVGPKNEVSRYEAMTRAAG
jgi:fructose-1,6-bisphosphatase